MVVAQEKRAARIGVEVLKRGGNAVDAAVAVGFAMAVTYPRAGNIGGGGFMMIHLANQQPAVRHRLSRDRACRDHARHLSRRSAASPTRRSRASSAPRSACPGTVAGLALAHQKYGSGKFKLGTTDSAGDRAGARRHPGRRRPRRLAAVRAADVRALAGLREDFSAQRRQVLAPGRPRWCRPISRARLMRSRATVRAPSTRVRSPRRSPPRSARPAA